MPLWPERASGGAIASLPFSMLSGGPEITFLLRNAGTTCESFLQPREGRHHTARRVNAGVGQRATCPTHHQRAPRGATSYSPACKRRGGTTGHMPNPPAASAQRGDHDVI